MAIYKRRNAAGNTTRAHNNVQACFNRTCQLSLTAWEVRNRSVFSLCNFYFYSFLIASQPIIFYIKCVRCCTILRFNRTINRTGFCIYLHPKGVFTQLTVLRSIVQAPPLRLSISASLGADAPITGEHP